MNVCVPHARFLSMEGSESIGLCESKDIDSYEHTSVRLLQEEQVPVTSDPSLQPINQSGLVF